MQKNVGLMRLVYACQYSWQGLKAALSNEAAFKQEFFGFVFLTIITFFLRCDSYRAGRHDYLSYFGPDHRDSQFRDRMCC